MLDDVALVRLGLAFSVIAEFIFSKLYGQWHF